MEFLLFLAATIADLLRAALSFAAALVFSVFYTLPSGSYVVVGEIGRQRQEYVVSSPATVTVDDILAKEGQAIIAGDVVMRFDDGGARLRAATLEQETSQVESQIAQLLAKLGDAGNLDGVLAVKQISQPAQSKHCYDLLTDGTGPDGILPSQNEPKAIQAPGEPVIPDLPTAYQFETAPNAAQESEGQECFEQASLPPFPFDTEAAAVAFFHAAFEKTGNDFSAGDKRLIESKAALTTRQAFALQEQTKKKREQLSLLNNEIQALEKFKTEGLLSDIQIDPLKIERNAVLLEVNRVAAEYAAVNSQMVDLQLRVLDRVQSERKDSLTRRLNDLIATRKSLLERLNIARVAAQEGMVASPINGKIIRIRTDLERQEVNSGDLLFTVEPAKSTISFRGQHLFGPNFLRDIETYCIGSIDTDHMRGEVPFLRRLSAADVNFDRQSIIPVQNANLQFELSDSDLDALGIPFSLEETLSARVIVEPCKVASTNAFDEPS